MNQDKFYNQLKKIINLPDEVIRLTVNISRNETPKIICKGDYLDIITERFGLKLEKDNEG